MNKAFDDACVVGWENLVHLIELPDLRDRHVVAAGIRGGADLIVTANLKDFPEEAVSKFGMRVKSPMNSS